MVEKNYTIAMIKAQYHFSGHNDEEEMKGPAPSGIDRLMGRNLGESVGFMGSF